MEIDMIQRVLLTSRSPSFTGASLALLLFTCAASGQIGYEARTRFALGHGANPTPITSAITLTDSGTLDLTLQVGIFGAQGFNNYGVGFWSGSIFASEPLLTRPSTPRVAPFNGAFGYDGNLNAEGTRIGLPGQRRVEPTRGDALIHYAEGEPVPGMPEPVGAEQFANLYRFSLTIDDLETARDIVVRAEGTNWPIEGFFTVQHTPPGAETGGDGFIWYSPDPAGHGPAPARPTHLSMLTISVVPSPGAALVFAMAAWLPHARRRSSP